MSDDAVEIKPTSSSTRLTINPVALLAPATKKSVTTQWRAPAIPSLVTRTNRSSQIHEISPVERLRLVAHRMSQAAPQGGVLPQVVDFVASAVACDACFVYVLEGDDLVLRASTNPQSGAADRVKLKSGPQPAGWVAEQREPVEIAQQAGADPRFNLFNKSTDERFEAFLLVPLVCRGRLVGIINIQNREPRHYGEREIGLISTIGFLVGAEAEMARLEEQNAELAERLRVRTLVERAKGLLQSDLGISEQEAYQKIQRQSQQMRKAMKDIAEAIVLSHAVTCAKPD